MQQESKSGGVGSPMDPTLPKARPGLRFPWKLHQLLTESESNGNQAIVSWLPSGKSFKVFNKARFSAEVMPAYFNSTKYKSFQRSLNVWGFECVSQGPDKGAMYQRFFERGNPELCKYMTRTSIKEGSNTTNQPNQTNGSLLLRAMEEAPRNDGDPPKPMVPANADYGRDNSLPFSQRLHRVLAQDMYKDAIAWMPHGRCFRVLNPQLFELRVLPGNFEETSYFAFMERLIAFGFTRIPKGRDMDCYYHEMIVRGLPHLCRHISTPEESKRFLPEPSSNFDFYISKGSDDDLDSNSLQNQNNHHQLLLGLSNAVGGARLGTTSSPGLMSQGQQNLMSEVGASSQEQSSAQPQLDSILMALGMAGQNQSANNSNAGMAGMHALSQENPLLAQLAALGRLPPPMAAPGPSSQHMPTPSQRAALAALGIGGPPRPPDTSSRATIDALLASLMNRG